MIRRILVPLDGSSTAEVVLPHVAALSRVFSSRVELLHVLPDRRNGPSGHGADPLASRLARAERAHYLQARVHELAAHGVDVAFRVEEGSPAEVIVELLRKGAYDAVGIAAHGGGDDPHLPMGCTATAVVLNAATSVLLVPSTSPGKETSRAPMRYRQVLAPVDCSPRSDWSLGAAAAVARGSGATLKLVHVLDVPGMIGRLPTSRPVSALLGRIKEMNRVEANRYIQEAIWRLGARGIEVEGEVVEVRRAPASALRELLSGREHELVVLSAHGLGGSTDWPLGGTAAKLTLWTGCPVLLLQDQPGMRKLSEGPGYMERVSEPPRISRTERRVAIQL